MTDQVLCHASYAYAVRPRALIWQGERLAVAAVLTEWRTPAEKTFRVRTHDDRFFDLIYDLSQDAWRIAPASLGIAAPPIHLSQTTTGEQNQ